MRQSLWRSSPARSVRVRLTLWYLLTLLASLTAFGAFVFVLRARTLHRELDLELHAQARELAAELKPALLSLDVAGALAADPRMATTRLIVREAPAEVLFRSHAFPTTGWTAEVELARAARQPLPLVTLADRTGVVYRVATEVVSRPGVTPLVLQVAAPIAPMRHTLGRLALAMLLSIVAVLVIAGFGSSSTVRRALAPVDAIVARVREVQAHRPGQRLDVDGGSDELDRLILTLNGMLDRIEASVRGARRFAADASHELQTPIAAMRMAVEGCMHAGDVPPRYAAMAGDLLADIERLSTLVRDLRLLALAESGHLLAGSPEPVDLAALVADCSEIARALGNEKQIRVETELSGRPFVRGNGQHLRRVLLNLTDNALRYSPQGSTVRIGLGGSDSEAVLSVHDEGCGIPLPDLPHIFEPFYRADPARARESGGTGLGLAIADQLVRAHGGRIEVASDSGQGAAFTVRLPLLNRAPRSID